MATISKDRRRLLLGTAATLGGLAAMAMLRPARAFEMQSISPGSDIGMAYSNRCGGTSEHAGLMSQLRSQLAANPSASSMTATCPICGCPVTVSR
jgi:hypothetical protein